MFGRNREFTDSMLFPVLIFTGGVMFYILWEGDPYYSVAFWAVMQMCTADGIAWVSVEVWEENKRKGTFFAFAALIVMSVLIRHAGVTERFGASPVLTQTKVSDNLFFDGKNVIEQTFTANKSFDTINLWLTKELRKDDSKAVYEIVLTGEEIFVLTISTLEDDPANRLGIPYYNLPVEVYKYGELKKDGEELQADLRLEVYMSEEDGI